MRDSQPAWRLGRASAKRQVAVSSLAVSDGAGIEGKGNHQGKLGTDVCGEDHGQYVSLGHRVGRMRRGSMCETPSCASVPPVYMFWGWVILLLLPTAGACIG